MPDRFVTDRRTPGVTTDIDLGPPRGPDHWAHGHDPASLDLFGDVELDQAHLPVMDPVDLDELAKADLGLDLVVPELDRFLGPGNELERVP